MSIAKPKRWAARVYPRCWLKCKISIMSEHSKDYMPYNIDRFLMIVFSFETCSMCMYMCVCVVCVFYEPHWFILFLWGPEWCKRKEWSGTCWWVSALFPFRSVPRWSPPACVLLAFSILSWKLARWPDNNSPIKLLCVSACECAYMYSLGSVLVLHSLLVKSHCKTVNRLNDSVLFKRFLIFLVLWS